MSARVGWLTRLRHARAERKAPQQVTNYSQLLILDRGLPLVVKEKPE